jgi:response regulator NasT
MNMRVLLVDDDVERAARVTTALLAAGYTVTAHLATTTDLMAQVRETAPDVIVIDRDSPDRDTLEHVCMVTRDDPRPIVLFTDDGDRSMIRDAVRSGISAYVVGGLTADRLRPVLEVAVARFEEHQALRGELAEAKASLANRKLIERAKGIVMKQGGVGEDEAYARLRKLAMDRNRSLAHVAQDVIDMAKLLA